MKSPAKLPTDWRTRQREADLSALQVFVNNTRAVCGPIPPGEMIKRVSLVAIAQRAIVELRTRLELEKSEI